jgi:hypothetical protein
MGQVLYYRYAYNQTRGMFGWLLYKQDNNETTFEATTSTTSSPCPPASKPDNCNESTSLLNSPSGGHPHSLTALNHKQSDQTRWIVRLFLLLSVLFWLVLLLGSAFFFFWPWAKEKVDLDQWHLLPQSLGWASAILYCCSRKSGVVGV